VLALLTPLWSLILFLQFGGWLLRPFTWRDAFDTRLAVHQRLVLGAVALTAALPLGGLAIPFWIHVRKSLWPGFEALRLQGRDSDDVSPAGAVPPACSL
jgi:hypothetical protein